MTGVGRAFGPARPSAPSYHGEAALSTAETTQLKRASDMLDEVLKTSADKRIAQAQDIIDRLTGEPEDPGEKNT